MARFDFTNDNRYLSLSDIVDAHPTIDHFHVVEEMDGKQYVFHFNVLNTENGFIILDENGRDCNPTVAGNFKVVGDEAHD